MVRAALDEVDLDQERLVVELLDLGHTISAPDSAKKRDAQPQGGDLAEESADEGERRGVVLHFEIHRRQLGLDAVAQERALLLLAPLDRVQAQLHLHLVRPRHFGHQLYQRAHWSDTSDVSSSHVYAVERGERSGDWTNLCCLRLGDVEEERADRDEKLLDILHSSGHRPSTREQG